MIRALAAGLLAALAAAYVVLFAGSVGGSVGVVVCSALAVWILDVALDGTGDERLMSVLNVARVDISWRVFIRQALIVVFLLTSDVLSHGQIAVVLAAVLVHHLAFGLFNVLRAGANARRLRRLETRNLDVPGDTLPTPVPEWLATASGQLLFRADLVLVAALGWAWLHGSYALMAPAAVVMVILALPSVLAFARQLWALLRLPDDELRMQAAQQAVLHLGPRVILYFSGGLTSVYQVNMWLETMERLDRPVLVLLRERRYLEDLAPTTAPVLCLPFTVDLMNFAMPSARIGLYVANVGRNLHLLREPGLKSAFIGHGDSDKTASFNPATKTYDEVWVAGEAGRERYRRAQVGVRDDEIVLVGRPQLDGIEEAGTRPVGDPYTVLYAPTWEGWTDDPHHTSLTSMGPAIVRELLATPGVRVVYKPHPLTGTVNPATSQANDDVVAAIAAAGAPHVSVLENARPLYELFNESDALVSDISSVVSDYLRSGKPYFVTNPSGLPDTLFRERNPSAGAAYLVAPDAAAALRDGLAEARGADPLRAHRSTVRTYLIGDPALDSMTLFRQAVDNLAAAAERQLGTGGIQSEDVSLTPAGGGQAR